MFKLLRPKHDAPIDPPAVGRDSGYLSERLAGFPADPVVDRFVCGLTRSAFRCFAEHLAECPVLPHRRRHFDLSCFARVRVSFRDI